MSNVLSEEERQQVLTLGRPGWSLRRIGQQTRVRRETARLLESGRDRSAAAGRMGMAATAKPAKEVTTGSDEAISGAMAYHPNSRNPENLPSRGKTQARASKPAKEMTTGFDVELIDMGRGNPKPASSLSACEPSAALFANGLDERSRIVGTGGKRPRAEKYQAGGGRCSKAARTLG